MLRAINTDTTHRRAATPAHRARPAGKITKEMIEEEHRMAYIGFIVKLMFQMKPESLERMLDAALEETE